MIGEFDFNNQVWKNISIEAKDFIRKLIVLNPDERMNID